MNNETKYVTAASLSSADRERLSNAAKVGEPAAVALLRGCPGC